MINGKPPKIIILDANSYWTRQLFSQFSGIADVLFVCPKLCENLQDFHTARLLNTAPRKICANIWEQDVYLPRGWLSYLWIISEKILLNVINSFKGDSSCLLVISYPHYSSIARKAGVPSIYYNFDDYRYHFMRHFKRIPALETKAVLESILTVCTAKYRANHLKRIIPEKSDKIFHIPNGCSPQFMVDQILHIPKPVPHELRSFSRPIAGYIGTLRNGFDFGYLFEVAKEMPEVTFILGGDYPLVSDGCNEWWQNVNRVKMLSNVHFIGAVEHYRLGEFLQSFDVLLMCYVQSEFNNSICPTKLWDYMGTARPIVANDVVPEVNIWKDVLWISENPTKFIENIYEAFDSPFWKSSERLLIAKQHTWSSLSERLLDIIQAENTDLQWNISPIKSSKLYN
jgi:glycosyltransferase involved in cell wall biosynthesis